ncbi:hypothetical protein FGG08_005628 [Glutinoglossum americanum]|uniref:Uncharacterized protein n=1 Tax=Glutinoglossum americanum TaxID=1670608 RepID=A0A9P8HY28_9PEZI|nr:hypothetical protein FGG08_005628 [Glutinoglossum americanum]
MPWFLCRVVLTLLVDPRMATQLPQRHHSVSEFDPMRSHSTSNLQSFYATQRFQSRPSEAEQMMQAKRKMAAQRERELRNYHQEQQYNRTILAEISNHGKPDRVMSPSAMSEDERRELIARQHRALYNTDTYPENNVFGDESNTPRPIGSGTGIPTSVASNSGVRGQSPLAFDPFGISQSQPQNGSVENSGQSSAVEQTQSQGQGQQATGTGPSPIQQRSRANSASSPSSKSASFSLFDNTGVNQQSSRTSTSSPGGSPPRQAARTSTTPVGVGVAPIGTRPSQTSQNQQNPALSKRSTTPLPSPLSFGFAASEDTFSNNNVNDRSSSATSNNTAGAHESGVGLGWGSKSGVWGNKNSLGVQASVWG